MIERVPFRVSLGAVWEDDELLTSELDHLRYNLRHHTDGYLEDSD